MDMHGLIMNLPCEWAMRDWSNTREAYMYGHRDARHAAAELALMADAEIERLRTEVRNLQAGIRELVCSSDAPTIGSKPAELTEFDRLALKKVERF